eukprot:maker-scaffold38_size502422-snap-gene-0.15 protein:Tk05859 transcript:maker-scaffold38_size502422-snap-gene-0.15-mRNA-1 annotation:"PREDICTED: uncharacterized protein LOC100372851"
MSPFNLNATGLNFTMTRETFLTNLFDPVNVDPSFTDPPPSLVHVNPELDCANCTNATSECLNCHNNDLGQGGESMNQDIYFLLVMICISFLLLFLVVMSMHRIIDMCFRQMVKSVRNSNQTTVTSNTHSPTQPSDIVVGRRERTGRGSNSRHPSLEILAGIFTLSRQNTSMANMLNYTNSLPRPSQPSTLGRGDRPPPYDDPPPYHIAISIDKDEEEVRPSPADSHVSAPNLAASAAPAPPAVRPKQPSQTRSTANMDESVIIKNANGLWNAGDPIVPPKCTLDITKNEFIPVILSEGTTGTKAVDERQSAQHGGQFCAQTRGSNPWVTLDLGQRARMVLQIRIALAEDEPMVSNMEIRFGNDSEHWKNPLCDWLDAKRVESSKGTVLDVEPCQHGGRFLSLASVNSLVPISLCDIQILVGPLEVLSKQLCPHNTGGITTKMGSCLHFNLK